MLLSIAHSPSSPHFLSKTASTPFPLPSFPSSSSLRLKNPKLYIPHCRSSYQEAVGKSAIQRISEKLRSLGYLPDDPAAAAVGGPPPTGPGSAGEIFIPTPYEIPKHRVGHTIDSSWSTPEHPVPEPGSGNTITRFRELWKREQESSTAAGEKVKMPTVAELTLPRKELKRLRTLGIALTKRLKVGKAGITEGIVNGIHERWRRLEVVKIRCEDVCGMNMKRTHEILERKTGGLVVWRSGNIVVLYRGTNYKYPYFHSGEDNSEKLDEDCSKPDLNGVTDKEHGSSSLSTIAANTCIESSGSRVRSPFISGVGSPNKLRLQLPGETQLEAEADKLLDGLGPRFTDWWGYDPLPVDGDLLPAIVPGFRKPFRLLPFGLRPQLKDRESTILRRLSRHVPCHFALGRNRNLQGLAVSIIKLWEKIEVAKIAIKRGAQNTNSGIMAEELKVCWQLSFFLQKLTGGTLLSRDKDFIILYRGKDFLPHAVSIAIEERRNWNSCDGKPNNDEVTPFVMNLSSSGRLSNSSSEIEVKEKAEGKRSLMTVRNLKSASSSIRKVEAKLNQVNQNIEMTKKHIAELERLVEPTTVEFDKEGISEEERHMLRRVGLRMKPFLLLGRRGVFDGTIENMHLHWKYRELVKIIFNDRYFENVESTARTLEAESGGILVAVERVSKGYAVVIYRGKNYRRPANLRPQTLLNKKEALKRSLEAQRYESLKLHALHLSKTADQLDYKIANNDLKMNMLLSSEFEGSKSPNDISDNIGPLEIDNDNGSEPEIESYTSFQSDFSGENVEMVVLEHQNESHDAEMAEHCLASMRKVSMSGSEGKSLDPELVQTSTPTTCAESSASEELSINVSCGGAHSLLGLSSLESNGPRESDVESIFRSSPLSNRERLLLRKQALKMRKRPVLAVGRNNILTGVARTIKTHFRKHPLAIVNINGRAKGTSVQELVFELEQATGSVLVSREPNKVILYRGWGEGDACGGIKKNGVSNMSMEVNDGLVSHQLIEAIKRECGLPSAEAQ
ncbi:CRM-domain containing factor CFM2, chloroplastic isoform X2 [Dendrobium catenatum]|uniref:CRM-domain containing factor CFM2, chloroplastic isoform X2 n=1 Tax=Dendrobium catenatum TaxID=906689 RepID=UPI00109F6284|nr:CRM-domain containing factor CFM2, chloroplastic isoform X2 [Dendrobium catenatum]